jgi:hypothetical protein
MFADIFIAATKKRSVETQNQPEEGATQKRKMRSACHSNVK